MEADSPQSSDTEGNFFHTLDWQGKGHPLLLQWALFGSLSLGTWESQYL